MGAPSQQRLLPGSCGEHELQDRYDTVRRARSFYERQVLDHLNEAMRAFVGRQEMMFVSTADAGGACDCSFRAGPPGFVHATDRHTVTYPEYRGNGVMASLGNILENGQIGLLFIDFFTEVIGLHVNGRAAIVENSDLADVVDVTPAIVAAQRVGNGRRPERWVVVEVDEAYIHCSKHIPWLARRDKAIYWGTDNARAKGGDHFGVTRERS